MAREPWFVPYEAAYASGARYSPPADLHQRLYDALFMDIPADLEEVLPHAVA